MIFVDELDIFILSKISQKKKIGSSTTRGTYILAKLYWVEKKFEKKLDEVRFYDSKRKIIEYRMKNLSEKGLILISHEDEQIRYELIEDNVRFSKRHKFFGGYHSAIHIKKEGKWIIIQI